MNALNGLEKITEIIKIVLASGFIDDKPLNLMLIAPVSSGKTTAIKQFKNNKNLKVLTDVTAYGILKKYEKELKNREIRHILIPDLLNSLSRRETTVRTLLLFINASAEDGLFPSINFSYEIKDYIEPFGWILCITTDGFLHKKRYLSAIGFNSRFLKVEYQYTPEQIQQILEKIKSEEKFLLPNIKVKNARKPVKIQGNKKIFDELETYSRLLIRNTGSEILRTQRILQTFLKSCAYLRNDTKVTVEDLNKLRELIDLIK